MLKVKTVVLEEECVCVRVRVKVKMKGEIKLKILYTYTYYDILCISHAHTEISTCPTCPMYQTTLICEGILGTVV